MEIVITLIMLGVIFIVVNIVNSKEFKENREAKYKAVEDERNIFDKILIENNILDNVKCKVLGNRFTYGLVYTNNDELYIISKSKCMLEKIDFEDILDIKIEYNIKEKNKMKLISVVPTFDRHTRLQKCVLKLMLDNKTHEFQFKPGVPSDGCITHEPINQRSSDVVDSMERMKLLIKRKLNTVNN